MAGDEKEKLSSKDINYHSKSPEKLLEELKKKNHDKNSKYNKNRRTALIIVAISGMIVVGLAFFVLIYKNSSFNTPDYIRNTSQFVFKIIAENEYEYGTQTEIKVRVSNIENKTRSFTFKDFKFFIESVDGEKIFSFSYPVETLITILEYDSRDIYDFQRENPTFSIKPGEYRIHSQFYVNEQLIELVKTIKVYENIETRVRLYNDYILPGQELPLYLTISNYSPDDVSFLLGTYRAIVEDGDSKADEAAMISELSQNENASGEFQVLQGQKLDILLGRVKFPEKEGNYNLKASYFLNDELSEETQEVIVSTIKSSEGLKELRILPYTVKVTGVGQKYTAEIMIVNDANTNVFEKVRGFIFEIERGGSAVYRYTQYEDRDINIYIPAFSKKLIFDSTQWREITFQETGKFQLSVRIILENGILEYSEEILVGE